MIDFNGCKALIQIFKKLSVLLSSEKARDQGLLLLFEGDKLLKLLLLELISD
jgi:hypothetical protein